MERVRLYMAVSANWLMKRRLRWQVLVAAVGVFLTLFGTPSVAYADPGDGEGGTQALREALEAAARGYYDAKAVLAASEQRQAEITEKLGFAELSLARLSAEVGNVASARYKGSQIGILNGLITGEGDPKVLLQGAAVADYLVWRDDSYLRLYRTTKEEAEKQKGLLEAELQIQAKQLADMDTQKREAEKALAAVGGMVTAGYTGQTPAAQPALRNADGSFPREGCSIDDPTGTGGCLTPRMFHTLNEARLAGFQNYVSCWRSGSWGEHPSGRACDLAASPYNFGAAATGADKEYGDRLATWAVNNAEALGIMYVIWYRQIWMVGSGWRQYSGWGDPSSEHTNHVHISML
jgi:peptidoglycan DL-endopeptidase CwlO